MDKFLARFGPKSWDNSLNDKVTFEDPTNGDAQKLKMDAELKQYARPAFPSVTYTNDELHTNDELQKIAQVYPDLSSYTTQETAKWVTKGGIDKELECLYCKIKPNGTQRLFENTDRCF